ncbi:MAG: HD domain-containing protein [Planctomycetota bacterium]|nr:HD domain-containing protein [Planctomycetota bacterium]
MILSPRFQQSLDYACIVHAGHVRKGTQIPYVSHLLAVAGLSLEYGANEDQAIAALLHDAVEDAGGKPRLEDIRLRFGDAVAEIVDGCTDAEETPKPPWRERKEKYIAHLAEASPAILLVSCCDKLHNSRCIVSDFRGLGEALWDRFRGKKDGTLWYYRSLVTAFQDRGEHRRLVEELDRIVTTMEQLSADA